MQPLTIRHITVRRGALDLEVAVPLAHLHVTPQLAQAIKRELPNLPKHVCVNGRGESFGDELVGTELPHLLEHTIIELQAQAAGRSDFTGHTSWAAELAETRPQGLALMRVTVTFHDDLTALAATKQATQLINDLIPQTLSAGRGGCPR